MTKHKVIFFLNQVYFLGNSGQVNHSHIISSFQCLDSNGSSLIFQPPEPILLPGEVP